MKGFSVVDKDKFYRVIGNYNVHPTPVGPWPYNSYFKTQLGQIIGIKENYFPDEVEYSIPNTRYWLHE
ncbi:MAG: hypothetical protein K9M94_13000 [Spirochaetia bacterium]|nr:hypothetical protein [Spirochaetia bacterium]